jgi:hypothetical protein
MTAPSAFAAPVTKTLGFPLSGSSTTNIFSLGPYACCTVSVFDTDIGNISEVMLSLDMGTTMTAPTHSDLSYTDTNLRQGRTLDLSNTYTRDAGGKLDVSYTLAFHANVYGFVVDPSKSAGDTLDCSVPLLTQHCEHTHEIGLFDITVLDIGLGKVNVHFGVPITTKADITGDCVSSVRTMVVAGNPILGPDTLNFASDPTVKPENTFLNCSLPVNEPVNYAMGEATSHVNGAVTENVGLDVSVVGVPIVGPDFTVLGPYNIFNFDLPSKTINAINLSAPGQNIDLGNLLPNNIVPTVGMDAVPLDGTEGSPIKLSVKGTGPGGSLSPCGDDSLDIHWTFDDGGSAFGKTIYHAFADNFLGNPSPPHSGKVTITDPTGLSKTLNFSVPVANVAPTVGAGPDKTAYWGVPVSFHGNGADAGSPDNGTLLYSWAFGDPGSPLGASGQDASHVYGAPSVTPYVATVTVTDNDGATGTSNVNVTVLKRNSTVAYAGDTSFRVTDAGTLRASLADGLTSEKIPGRTVAFYVNGVLVGSAVTDNSGNASIQYTPPLGSVGTQCVVAQFAGDSYYNSTASTGGCSPDGTTLNVGQNPAVLTYTGSLTSSPSKAVTLTAKLTDDLGRPLANKPVNFTLGAQVCNGAVTSATGIVSCTIPKLNQNPKKYPFIAAFPGDANYAASSVNAVFSINSK